MRRTWLDNEVDLLLEELGASGMHLDRRHAGELITDRVRAVAALIRVLPWADPGERLLDPRHGSDRATAAADP